MGYRKQYTEWALNIKIVYLNNIPVHETEV